MLVRLRQRLEKLAPVMPQVQFKKALAGIALLAGVGLAAPAAAQTFSPGVLAPFGLPGQQQYLGFPAFTDIDADGDLDLFLMGYKYDDPTYTTKIFFFENMGTPQVPDFQTKEPEANPFGLSFPSDPTTLFFGDLDDDGDPDLIFGKYEPSGFEYLENTGSPDAPAFGSLESNPFGLTSSSQDHDVPVLADLDADGDLDLLSSEYYGDFRFFQNSGTAQAPAFEPAVANPFGLETPPGSILINLPAVADVDVDGDLDVLSLGLAYSGSSFYYFENQGDAQAPAFAAPATDPFGFNGLLFPLPAFADLDSDGDPDLMVHDYTSGSFVFFENLHFDMNFPPMAGSNAITILEDEVFTFSLPDIPFLDGDLSDQLDAIQIATLPAAGELKLNDQPVTVGQIIPAAGFANFAFQPAPDGNGSPYAEFQFWVSDGDEWSVDAGTITFNVEPINDFPSGSNGEVTAVQDQDFLFSPDDFPFADVDGDMLHAIRIVSPVTKGKLTLNGLDVTANQNIPADELSQLTFTPDPGEFGDNYASFEYRVADDLLLSQEVFTMTIDVNMASGTNEPLAGATVRLSPNPASDAVLVQVETSAALGDVSLEVLDGLGQNLFRLEFSQTGNAFEHELDVSGWAAGVYFVKIQADGAERVLRFLKK